MTNLTKTQANDLHDIIDIFDNDYSGLTGDPTTQKLVGKLEGLREALTPAEVEARLCRTCSKNMTEGYYCCDEYYCSEACLNKSFEGTGTTWEAHYTEDGDCYYTEWED